VYGFPSWDFFEPELPFEYVCGITNPRTSLHYNRKCEEEKCCSLKSKSFKSFLNRTVPDPGEHFMHMYEFSKTNFSGGCCRKIALDYYKCQRKVVTYDENWNYIAGNTFLKININFSQVHSMTMYIKLCQQLCNVEIPKTLYHWRGSNPGSSVL
jgi:hypothetical protein